MDWDVASRTSAGILSWISRIPDGTKYIAKIVRRALKANPDQLPLSKEERHRAIHHIIGFLRVWHTVADVDAHVRDAILRIRIVAAEQLRYVVLMIHHGIPFITLSQLRGVDAPAVVYDAGEDQLNIIFAFQYFLEELHDVLGNELYDE